MSRASEYAKAWAEIDEPDPPLGCGGYVWYAYVTRSGGVHIEGDLPGGGGDVDILIAWLTDTFTDGGT